MQKDFSKQLIKGKIAELVFDQMFRETRSYTVIPFGYESIVPELMQYAKGGESRELLNNIRNAPDFALVAHEPREVSLVEVKYRTNINLDEIRTTASQICERWKLAHIFIATPTGFYYDSCHELAQPEERPTPLSHSMVPETIQNKYLELLREFIRQD